MPDFDDDDVDDYEDVEADLFHPGPGPGWL